MNTFKYPCTSRPTHLIAGALAVLASPLALAQASNVTLFGTLDLNITATRSGGKSQTAMDQGGNLLPSRFGLRGMEDLGGGAKASFWIESGFSPDSGQITGSTFWGRRSTLSLSSAALGELRLGRDYTPTFWNMSRFAPFGTVGVGGSANLVEGWPFGIGGANTVVRSNQSIGYFLPADLGGVYGQAMLSKPAGADEGKYIGARLGYQSGPLDVAMSYGTTDVDGQKHKMSSLGGRYNFGVLTAMAYYFEQKIAAEKQSNALIGLEASVGPGTVKASYAQAQRSGAGVDGDDATQFALGYVYPLSKRTAAYTTYSLISNQGRATFVTADSSPAAKPGGKSSGLQIGISHNF